jgi:hypothetical protein
MIPMRPADLLSPPVMKKQEDHRLRCGVFPLQDYLALLLGLLGCISSISVMGTNLCIAVWGEDLVTSPRLCVSFQVFFGASLIRSSFYGRGNCWLGFLRSGNDCLGCRGCSVRICSKICGPSTYNTRVECLSNLDLAQVLFMHVRNKLTIHSPGLYSFLV